MAEHSEDVTELLLRLGGSGPEALDMLRGDWPLGRAYLARALA